jgi:hypothetical protein
MSLNAISASTPYFAPQEALRSYVKAEQDCGVVAYCFLTVCHKIIRFISCFFKTICSCCFGEERSDKPVKVNNAPVIPIVNTVPVPVVPKIKIPDVVSEQEIQSLISEYDEARLGWEVMQSNDPFRVVVQDIFQLFAHFLEVKQWFICSQVCKSWNHRYKDPVLWLSASAKMGVPTVEGERSNRRVDFKIICKMIAVSKRTIGLYIGEMVQAVPKIRAERFERWRQRDPVDPNRFIINTHRIAVVPSCVKRTQVTAFDVDEQGDLITFEYHDQNPNALHVHIEMQKAAKFRYVYTKNVEPKDLENIPLSLRNLHILVTRPFKGWPKSAFCGNPQGFFNPRFYKFSSSRFLPPSKDASIYFVRTEIVCTNMTWDAQKQSVEGMGYGYEMISPFIGSLVGLCSSKPCDTSAHAHDLFRNKGKDGYLAWMTFGCKAPHQVVIDWESLPEELNEEIGVSIGFSG